MAVISGGMEAANPATPVEMFEADYAALRRRSKMVWAVGTGLFLVLFLLSAWLGDFFKVTQVTTTEGTREWRWVIPAGIPRLGEFIEKTIPVLRWESLGADFANWFWRWQVWLRLLFETILIAFMATTFGVIGGFLLSFPASRNLAPNVWVLWITRRYLEIARTVP
ncbi:MAG: phosphonate ABC transporter, permease protein PhnE, partial [Pseudomonadota bacterium]